jgi:hypothetical protein
VVGGSIHEILNGLNDGLDRRYWEKKELERISISVTDIPICHNSHKRRNPSTKEKEREKKYYNVHGCIYSTEYSPKPHITCDLGLGG